MSTTFKQAGPEVILMVSKVLRKHRSHEPVLDAGVTFDILFAHASEESGCALEKNGVRELGITRIVNLCDRVKGLADVEIKLDGNWWDHTTNPEREALLDHQLHHIEVQEGKRDDIGRPVIKLRHHDVDVGWFAIVAERNGIYAVERTQAKSVMDAYGQYFWPDVVSVFKASDADIFTSRPHDKALSPP